MGVVLSPRILPRAGQEPDTSYTGGEHQRIVSLELLLFSLPFPGTVPLSVWKLPLVTKVDLSGNLLTRLTGETAHKVMEVVWLFMVLGRSGRVVEDGSM